MQIMKTQPFFKENVKSPNKKFAALTRRVSQPPTILRPRPRFPLQISMVHSLPATIGQRWGSENVGAGSTKSDLPVRQVCVLLKDEEEGKGALKRE